MVYKMSLTVVLQNFLWAHHLYLYLECTTKTFLENWTVWKFLLYASYKLIAFLLQVQPHRLHVSERRHNASVHSGLAPLLEMSVVFVSCLLTDLSTKPCSLWITLGAHEFCPLPYFGFLKAMGFSCDMFTNLLHLQLSHWLLRMTGAKVNTCIERDDYTMYKCLVGFSWK